jgi:hypothetical protein
MTEPMEENVVEEVEEVVIPEEEAEIVVEEEVSQLELSDEEFLKLEAPSFEEEEVDPTLSTEEVIAEIDADPVEKVLDTEVIPEVDGAIPEEGVVVPTEDIPETAVDKEAVVPKAEAEPKEKVEKVEAKPELVVGSVEYKVAEYDKMMGEFKANGTMTKAKNSDDAKRMMQMGMNYHEKMAAIKPALTTVKLLDKHGLIEDPSKLDFLLDLHNKKPDAIKQLIKDSGLDPLEMEIDPDDTRRYTPESHEVNPKELELDSALESIQGTETYDQTLDSITNQWDAASQDIVVNNAQQILPLINDQIASGIFGKIMEEVKYERSMGRLGGVTDYQAYLQTGNKLNAAGAFKPVADKTHIITKPVVQKNTKAEIDRTTKKKAAATTKAVGVKQTALNFNPLDLSDEAFEEFDKKGLVR